MRTGQEWKEFEFDFSRSPCNEGLFSVKVTQNEAPDSIGTEIKFPAKFKGDFNVGLDQKASSNASEEMCVTYDIN